MDFDPISSAEAISDHVRKFKDEIERQKSEIRLLKLRNAKLTEENSELQLVNARLVKELGDLQTKRITVPIGANKEDDVFKSPLAVSKFKSPRLASTPNSVAFRTTNNSLQPGISFKRKSPGIDLFHLRSKRDTSTPNKHVVSHNITTEKPSPVISSSLATTVNPSYFNGNTQADLCPLMAQPGTENHDEEELDDTKQLTQDEEGLADTRPPSEMVDIDADTSLSENHDDLADTKQLTQDDENMCDSMKVDKDDEGLDDTKELTQEGNLIGNSDKVKEEEKTDSCQTNSSSSIIPLTQALNLLDAGTEDDMETGDSVELLPRASANENFRKPSPVIRGKAQPRQQTNANDSYDLLPQWRKNETKQPCVEVVRKKADRKQYCGTDCAECRGYYQAVGHEHREISSRHRANQQLPDTPEGFWDLSWRDTGQQGKSSAPSQSKGVVKKLAPTRRRHGLKVSGHIEKATLRKAVRLSQSPAI